MSGAMRRALDNLELEAHIRTVEHERAARANDAALPWKWAMWKCGRADWPGYGL